MCSMLERRADLASFEGFAWKLEPSETRSTGTTQLNSQRVQDTAFECV